MLSYSSNLGNTTYQYDVDGNNHADAAIYALIESFKQIKNIQSSM